MASFAAGFFAVVLVLTGSNLIIAISAKLSGVNFVRIAGPSSVTVGVPARFSCSAVCVTPCTYNWTVLGHNVQGPNITVTSAGGENTMVLQCTAFIPGSNRSSGETKTASVINPYSVSPVEDKEPIVDHVFSLLCKGPQILPDVLWYKDGKQLTSDSRITLAANNTVLIFSRLLASDTGRYQCRTTVDTLNIYTEAYFLNFETLSVRITGPDNVQVETESVFQCVPTCTIGCSIHWSFRFGFPQGSFSMRNNTIRWTPSEPDVIQIFTCVAKNLETGRSASDTKHVTVAGIPVTKLPSGSGGRGLDRVFGVGLCVELLYLLIR